MFRRFPVWMLLGILAFGIACTNKKAKNQIANVDSKQPDKVLFDRAMEALRHNRYDVARLTLQTLINTYPDSEFIARAKLGVADSWYVEGGSAALAQAENEYNDFKTFFPNMPEAAEAQLKIANIHYQQMEKADRDYTHAKRAEDEYRKVILQYPDSKLVPEAKRRLMEVQEVLGEREYGIGRFYYLRQSYPASIARLQSLVEKYPLYSGADEALYLLGQNYEGQIARIRQAPTCDVHNLPRGCAREADKAHYIDDLSKKAGVEYAKILTRYPLMDRAEDAKRRLSALQQPIPRPTKAAVAQNKAEIESRGESTMMQQMMSLIKKGPDIAKASQVGNPSLVDPEPVTASEIQKKETMSVMEAASGRKDLGLAIVNNKEPGANGAPPSGEPAAGEPAPTGGSPFAAAAGGAPPSAVPDPNELKPNVPADPNELKPIDSGVDQALPPPTQVNEIQRGPSSSSRASEAGDSAPASDEDLSSS